MTSLAEAITKMVGHKIDGENSTLGHFDSVKIPHIYDQQKIVIFIYI